MFEIPETMVVAKNIGRAGVERYNAFMCNVRAAQELVSNNTPLMQPLMDATSVAQHGLRLFDASTRYVADVSTLGLLSTTHRSMLRDWHCMNPYLLNGTIDLGTSMPNIKLGCRLRIPNTDPTLQETYYIEGYQHTWSLMPGGKTSVTVTRGWIGTDLDLVSTTTQIAANYAIPEGRGA
jgi:hypothetical protein